MDILEHYPVADYGKLIYHYRTINGITQQELASGICSIPYLSKLENSKLDHANEETIQLLMKRLNVDYYSFQQDINEITDRLEEWYKLIKFKKIEQAKETYVKLEAYFSGEILVISLKYWFELFRIKYHILLNELEQANTLIQIITSFEKNLSNVQLCYFLYFKGIMCCVEKEFNKGLTFFNKAEAKFIELKIIHEELYYHLSLTHSYVYNTALAIYYGEKALKLFNNLAYYPRSIDCQLILAINYTRVQNFLEAKKYYSNLLEISKSSNDAALSGKVLNNLGYLYFQADEVDQSIYYYLESLSYKSPAEANYGNTIYGLVEAYLLKEDIDNALKTIDEGLARLNAEDTTNKVKLTIKYMEINQDNSLKEYLENIAVPYFIEKEDHINLSKSYEKLAKLHSDHYQYKKGCYYFSLSIDYRNKINNLKGGIT